ncbi:amidohydrolase [Lachnospiraceae bacterium PF1-22]|uniref:amidohydrolase n=1 Tax=Ohessyouella blattaphilus TaxID=2949333 RepID=UPI003E1D630C
MNVADLAKEKEAYIIERRRYFHQHPELSFEEKETTQVLASELARMGLEVETFADYNGVVGVLRGRQPGKTVMLRADIDALPVKEACELPYKSENDNMHACGHDCHMAMLLGAAEILSEYRQNLVGTIKFLFQAAEESTYGAKYYLKKGVLDDVDAIMGMHIWSGLAAHKLSIEGGPRMASCDNFVIKVKGLSSHACAPHLGKDAILAATGILMNLQSQVSRNNDPNNPLVVSVGTINGGTRFNIVADQVVMEGTVRTFSPEQRQKNEEEIRNLVTQTAKAFGCTAKLTYTYGPGAVINTDEKLVSMVKEAGVALYGEDFIGNYEKQMVSEDFSYYSEKVPSVFAFLGCRNEAIGAAYAHHNECFQVDESVLKEGAALYAKFALQYLEVEE